MTIRYSVFRRWTLLRVLIAGVALVASTVVGASDSPPRGIAVAGRGEAKGKPGIVELSGTVTGEAELASDAITKYRDNRQRAIEALENLKIDGMKVTGSGVSINSALSAQAMQQMMNGMGTSGSGNARLQVTEPLTITVSGVDRMSTEDLLGMLVRIVDAGKDAGIAIGPAFEYNPYVYNPRAAQPMSLARFRMADVKDLRTQAYAAAIKDAREQAERLAAISGVKLGRVMSVREGAPQQATNVNVVYYGVPAAEPDADAYTTSKLEDVTVKIILQVEFSIE